MRLGIDFGTCYSSAALLLDSSLKPIREPLNHGYSFPSSVFLTPEGKMLVGFVAENKRMQDIQRYEKEFKRDLGHPEPLILGDKQFHPEDLVTEVIAKLKMEADKVLIGRGERSLTQAILTVPATYMQPKRQLMLQACDRAGFSQIKLLEEPVAAAIYYSQTAKIAEGDTVLVYDLGGGTFDVTLLQKQDSGYQILGMPDGDPNCGGVDFDRFIFQELLKNCSEELRQKLIPKESIREKAFVTPMCRNLKHQLSEASEAEISIPLTMESFSLTRSRFNEMIDGLVSETIACCDRLISNAELEWSQIDRVLLVGGSCRIPYVREVIARKWGKTPVQIDDPELAVCLGAAIYGAELESESPEAYLQKGLAKIQAGDYQSAIAEFNHAIELDSNYALAYCHRGLARAQLKEDRAALEDYDLAIRLDRNYGEAYLHRGDLRCQFNDLKGAIEDYDHALFVNPDLTEAAEKKELVFERLISISQPQVTNSTVSVDETVQSERQEVNLESDENQPTVRDNSASELEAQKYLTKAQEHLDRGDIEKSIVMLRESITLNPNCAKTHNCLGIALRNQGLLDEAKVELETALILDNFNFNAHHNLGIILHKQGHLEEAISEYQEAIRLDPSDANTHHKLGITLYKQGYLEEAISEYQEAIRLDPSDYWSHNMLGIALHKQGHLEEAISEYKEVLNLKPNLNVARNRLETAETELKQRTSSNLEVAEAHVELKTSTYNPELPSEWGADYTKLRDLLAAGNWKEADLETKTVFQQFGGLFDPTKSKGATGTAIATAMFVTPLAIPVVMAGFNAYAKNKIKNIPQTDLSTIDRLWVEYSNGHFGFSVQEKIFTQVGKKEGDFGERVRWRGKAGTFGGAFAWKNHNQLTFSLNAPRGHLPSLPWWSKDGLSGLSNVFYSRVKSCQLNEQN